MTRLSRPIALVAFLFVCALAFAQTDVARRIIHEEHYRPTPGDVYTLTINYGVSPQAGATGRSETIPLILQADYRLVLPYIGAIDARTLTYTELQTQVTTRLRERLLVPFVSLTLTAPAVYDVFIWGSVNNPGYHTVTSLSRLLDAVAVAGGTQAVGSRRQIAVHGTGGVRRYDLVAFLAQGDEAQNPFIRPGDRVHVPIADAAVEIRGAVVKPGRYEILGNETIGELLALAGQTVPTAQIERATVNRLNERNRYAILDLSGVDVTTMPARSGDIVIIPDTTRRSEAVQLEGAVHRSPAQEGSPRAVPLEPILIEVPYTPGLTVLRVLEQFGGPTQFAEPERSFIIRADGNRREPIPDLGPLWTERRWDRDINLAPGDRLVIPMKRLVVAVGGSVVSAGAFAYTSGYTVGDYIELAGGIDPDNGSAQRLFFAQPDGARTPVGIDTPVPIGANIYVGRSLWGRAKYGFGNFFTVTGWVTGIIGVTIAVIEFVQFVGPLIQ